jgi:hypothetical protein
LFSDPNWGDTHQSEIAAKAPVTPPPDHIHDWYPFWDVKIGRPVGARIDRPDGAYQREFQRASVVYNPAGNRPVTVEFPDLRKRASDGGHGLKFKLQNCDGDLFLKIKPSRPAARTPSSRPSKKIYEHD